MSSLREPRLETRRSAQLSAELLARARAWLPAWRPPDTGSDFAGTLLAIAARFESEVAQRLDKLPEKMYRGYIGWLGVRGLAAQAARIPLVFGLAPGANTEPVLAQAPIRAQAAPPQAANGPSPAPVTFETEDDVMIVPGTLAALIGADPANDAFYQAPAGFSALEGPTPGPDSWTVVTTAPVGATQIQLTPPTGLDSLPILLDGVNMYTVTAAQGGLVTVDPPVIQALAANAPLVLYQQFDPFNGSGPRRNLQEHAVYIGSDSLLNLPTSATIGVNGIGSSGISWFYWGKQGSDPTVGWQSLTSVAGAAAQTLTKTPGSVDEYSIDGKSSRWLKGTVPAKAASSLPVSGISLVINPTGCGQPPACPPLSLPATPVAVEGMANTTPLVLNAPFYPLGREPRLFDAFYIGCAEAFSKSNAAVSICLQALDGTAFSYSAAQAIVGPIDIPVLFGVSSDGFLRRMRPGSDPGTPIVAKTAVRPPLDQSGRASISAAPASLSAPQGRLTIYPRAKDALVAVAAGNDVWIWSEKPDPDLNGNWYFLGTPSKSSSSLPPAVILMEDDTAIHAVALLNGALFETSLAVGWESASVAQWSSVTAPGAHIWSTIAPVFDQGSPNLAPPFANGWIAVANDGTAFLLQGVNGSILTKPLPDLATSSRPLAVRQGGQPLLLFSATPDGTAMDAWTVTYDAVTIPPAPQEVAAALSNDSLDWTVSAKDGPGAVFATKDRLGRPALAVWYPQANTIADPNTAYLSPPLGALAGAPAVIPGMAVAPGADARIVALPFDPNGLVATSIFSDNLATALVIDNAPDYPKANDIVVVKVAGGKRKAHKIAVDAANVGGNLYWIKIPGSEGNTAIAAADVYRPKLAVFTGTVDAATPDQITVDAADTTNTNSGPLLVSRNNRLSFHTVTSLTAGPPSFLTVKPKIRGAAAGGTSFDYQYLTAVDINPSSRLPLITQNLAPDLTLEVKTVGANFRGGQPAPNPLRFIDPAAATATFILENAWTTAPTEAMVAGNMAFSLIKNAVFGSFIVLGGSVTANPALSWEYFDGNAWWKIPALNDKTSNLRTTGTVSFCVPAGLQPTDVAGKKSYWIRARLVGGDYGQETVTVKSVTNPDGSTTQTIIRSQNGIDPPLTGAVNLTYAMCCATNPDFVLTSDGGTLIDQTSVNNSKSAAIQLFLPLSTSIQSAASGITPADASSGPAIYLGFDGPIQDGPINILFLVKNQDLGNAYPLRVDVLRETGFVSVTAEDGTRGLGESGILSVYLPDLPPIATLFGSALRWLRVRPGKLLTNASSWTPVIQNAYVNAIYGLASETQTRERLGSSDGSPSQKVTVARPPVLEGSLEIRVLEPLGDEAVAALKAIDSNNVLTTLEDPAQSPPLPAPSSATPPQSWVLWTEIDVIEEAAKDQRCYTLDNDSGTITFGDGIHGMIPPIGTDSIVARIYKRGGGSAANSVTRWTSVNLISPIQGITQVVAPDDAAGGSDPQTAEEILGFAPALGYMRDRALTLRDFEVLAEQSSRDIAQARALTSGAGVRLVVAARGANPTPTQAQWRAVLAYLAKRCPPSLANPNAIVKVPPRLVSVQVTLTLDIEDISFSGGVANAATAAIVGLFDPSTGGFDGQGWPLGVLPTENDIAGVLADVPNLLAIEALTLSLTAGGATVQSALPEDLPVADAGNILITFQVTPVEVSA